MLDGDSYERLAALSKDPVVVVGAVPMAEWQVYRLTGEPLHALAGRAARPAGDA